LLYFAYWGIQPHGCNLILPCIAMHPPRGRSHGGKLILSPVAGALPREMSSPASAWFLCMKRSSRDTERPLPVPPAVAASGERTTGPNCLHSTHDYGLHTFAAQESSSQECRLLCAATPQTQLPPSYSWKSDLTWHWACAPARAMRRRASTDAAPMGATMEQDRSKCTCTTR